MELRHLRYFVAVAEELHFRRAGERLYVAQPAVSEQVRKLELELGVKLFERDRRNVALTSAGSALLPEARRVLRQAEIAMAAARNAGEQATMALRIGYLPDSLPAALPRALRNLCTSTPNVRVQLETGPALSLIEDLRAQRLDAVVTGLPAPTTGLRVTGLDHQDAIVAMPATHREATSNELDRILLGRERVVVLAPELNPAFHTAVAALCREAGVHPTFTAVASVDDALLAVAASGGFAVLPGSVAERHVPRGVRFVALEGGERAFQTAVLTDPDTETLATAAFLRSISVAATMRLVTGMAEDRAAALA
jgi:DNA-binding transcriptional LysR family regulator